MLFSTFLFLTGRETRPTVDVFVDDGPGDPSYGVFLTGATSAYAAEGKGVVRCR